MDAAVTEIDKTIADIMLCFRKWPSCAIANDFTSYFINMLVWTKAYD